VAPSGAGQPGTPASGARRAHAAGEAHRSLRERVAATHWRRRVAARRPLDHGYRLVVGAVGSVVVAFGLVTIPLPGPGWLTVIAGLFLLATEFTWAERLLDFTRRHVRAWTGWLGRQRAWVRVAVALATAAFVYGALVVVLHVMGAPAWVPGWVPLWR
jgi:uncharacterized protein (TIGR02611 family)